MNSVLPRVFTVYTFYKLHADSLVYLLWFVYCTPAEADIAHTEERMEESNGPIVPTVLVYTVIPPLRKLIKKKFSL